MVSYVPEILLIKMSYLFYLEHSNSIPPLFLSIMKQKRSYTFQWSAVSKGYSYANVHCVQDFIHMVGCIVNIAWSCHGAHT